MNRTLSPGGSAAPGDWGAALGAGCVGPPGRATAAWPKPRGPMRAATAAVDPTVPAVCRNCLRLSVFIVSPTPLGGTALLASRQHAYATLTLAPRGTHKCRHKCR